MDFPKLNKLIHEQTKLKILVFLSSNIDSTFMELKTKLNLTSGNLSIQLKNLEDNKLISQKKTIEKKKTNTSVKITEEGKKALLEYLDELEKILSHINKGNNNELN